MKQTLSFIAIGILLAVIGYLTYTTISGSKRVKTLTAEINAYRSAKPDTVTTIDSIILPGGVVYKLVPKVVIIHDTIIRQISECWYDSTFKSEGLRFRYRAHTLGTLNDLTFSDFVIPKTTVTITRTLDTCFSKPPEYRPKFLHCGLYTELSARNLKEFPGIGAGIQLIFKDQVTVSAGAMYQKGVYGNVRIGVLLK